MVTQPRIIVVVCATTSSLTPQTMSQLSSWMRYALSMVLKACPPVSHTFFDSFWTFLNFNDYTEDT